MADAFNQFVHQRTILLTTYRRDGTPVSTPVNIVVDGERAFVRTFDTPWKLKRIRKQSHSQDCTVHCSRQTHGPAIRTRARVLGGTEADHASHMLNRKHPILHGILAPLAHRLQGL